jgi:hypothetical protein
MTRFEDFGGKRRPDVDFITTGEGLFGLLPEEKADHPKTKALLRLDMRPQQANLTNARFRKQTLPPDREAKLLADVLAGDARAADEIVRAHLPWVQAEAKRKWARLNPRGNSNDIRGVTIEDFVAAGLFALHRAIKSWCPGANNGFNAYYRKAVVGAIAEAAVDWRHRGVKAESRIQRLIRAHPDWRADWLLEEFKKRYPEANAPSPDEIGAEQAVAYALWEPAKYDEASTFDDAGDHDKDGVYKGGDETQFNGPVRGYEGGAVGEWSRSQAANGLHPARKMEHPSLWVKTKKGSGSVWADQMLAGRDHRVAAEIDRIGCRAYAQHLVDQQPIDPKAKYYVTSEYSPAPKPSPFDAAISASIGSADIAQPSNDNFFKKAA